jgi:flagellar M-ring protein FliF
MNDSASKFLSILGSLPLSKKISMAFVLILVVAGFALMFIWANQIDYQVLYNNLSPEDAGAIMSELKDRRIPHKIEANGTVIMVPAERVFELRLALASEGLPYGGNVGFEIFDHLDFRTTKFVQELNYKRALQGELARTINNFREVTSSRVFIVLPKESLFVEDRKPASASIQLDVRSSLPPNKLAAIVHLVASAVEGLEPEQVTVVDTKGTVIFKGGNKDDADALLSNAQLDYKKKVENQIRTNVQSMLEGIVGPGKAIVRVNAEIDFNKISLSEEEYDPSTTVLRSKRNIVESTETGEAGVKTAQTLIDKRRGVLPPSNGTKRSHRKEDVTTNYEINKIIKTTLQPAGNIQRLSVAAVIDGTYRTEKLKDGTISKKYISRTQEELRKFEDIVKRAMGYSEDREDQVSVSSIPFSEAISMPIGTESEEKGIASYILRLMGTYRNVLLNLMLVSLVFLLIVRPLLKSIKNVNREAFFQRKELPRTSKEYHQITEPGEMSQKDRAIELARGNPRKTQQLIKGWIGEQE